MRSTQVPALLVRAVQGLSGIGSSKQPVDFYHLGPALAAPVVNLAGKRDL